MNRAMTVVVITLSLQAAAEPDVSSLYEVRTDGTSTTLKAGEQGKVVISIAAKNGAHVSDEAPLKIELSSKDAKLEKSKLTLADSVVRRAEGSSAFIDPRFEVPFTTATKTAIDAKLTFFICTEKICARQTRTLSLPVVIN